jgi:phosphoribosyl 1,2-cyclic phosphodiesterase
LDVFRETAVGPSETSSARTETGVSVRCWGVRGSVPTPGDTTLRYGGNTPCVEVVAGDERIILDAGTGIRLLGGHLLGASDALDFKIFLTHFHWDHIQGIPFFPLLFNPGAKLNVTGPKQQNMDVRTIFAGQMGPIYFPVPFYSLAANLTFDELNEGTREIGPVKISAMRVRHPSFTVGYRLDANGRRVCYIPDNELEGGMYGTGPDWGKRLRAFIRGADVLFHDSMYTEEEYPNRVGWGHSTFRQTLELAIEAGVKRLVFFHHAPERTDEQLDAIVGAFREEVASRSLAIQVDAASEGTEILI